MAAETIWAEFLRRLLLGATLAGPAAAAAVQPEPDAPARPAATDPAPPAAADPAPPERR